MGDLDSDAEATLVDLMRHRGSSAVRRVCGNDPVARAFTAAQLAIDTPDTPHQPQAPAGEEEAGEGTPSNSQEGQQPTAPASTADMPMEVDQPGKHTTNTFQVSVIEVDGEGIQSGHL